VYLQSGKGRVTALERESVDDIVTVRPVGESERGRRYLGCARQGCQEQQAGG
jgi:hypothetical protein